MKFAKTKVLLAMFVATSVAFAGDTAADARTTLQVKLALLDKLGADSLHVDVEASGGHVVLRGTVNRRETMELAETVAASATGVAHVKNDIRLGAETAEPSKAGAAVGEAEAEVKDAMLSTKVRLTLIDKMGTDGFRIGTEVANGVVTLELDPDLAPRRREEAMAAVRAVEGVSRVLSVEKK